MAKYCEIATKFTFFWQSAGWGVNSEELCLRFLKRLGVRPRFFSLERLLAFDDPDFYKISGVMWITYKLWLWVAEKIKYVFQF